MFITRLGEQRLPDWNAEFITFNFLPNRVKTGFVEWIVNGLMRIVSKGYNSLLWRRNPGDFQYLFRGRQHSVISSQSTFRARMHTTSHPQLAKEILNNCRNGKLFQPSSEAFSFCTQLLQVWASEWNYDDLILTADEEHSIKYHQFLRQYLSREYLESLKQDIQDIVDATLSKWESSSNPINLQEQMRIFSFEVMGKLFLGIEDNIEELSRIIDEGIYPFLSTLAFRDKNTLTENEVSAIRTLQAAIDKAMKKEVPGYIVEKMFFHKYSISQIKAMIFVLICSGQNKTANTMNALLYKIAQNPSLQEGVIEGKVYVKELIVEILRYMPAVSVIGRVMNEDQILRSQQGANYQLYALNRGEHCLVAPFLMARDPRLLRSMGENLETFEPTRWNGHNIDEDLANLPWMPFGDGLHRCPGVDLTNWLMEIFFTTIIDRYEISTEMTVDLPQRASFSTRLEGDIWISLKARG